VNADIVVGEDGEHVSARRYHHPGLNQPVVRLAPEARATVEDLTQEHLGFHAPDRTTNVGRWQGRAALGFLEWVLVNDPARARYAIGLAKVLDCLVDIDPDEARRDIPGLAKTLGEVAPHFLPAFLEQAGRMFIEQDSPEHASSMFARARAAEQTHGLAVDVEQLHLVFLEFGAVRALNNAVMSDYSRALSALCAPDDAFFRFRELCLQWAMHRPPYRRMAREIRRLARAAELNVTDVDDAILRELLATPMISRADDRFWLSYQDALVSLGSRDPAFRGTLLGIFSSYGNSHALWLKILTASGATAALTQPAGTVSAEAEAPDGPAG
jgi:hypothetical protein